MDQFDKLLLASMYIFVMGMSIYSAHTGDATAAQWAREQGNTIGGAIIGLVTGQIMAKNRLAAQGPPPLPLVYKDPHA